MVRFPCCENMGLKKGPWTPEEDEILISFIQRYGHQNWRAIPKQAGILRCGKSCRLRWINYLRPDIKRGNFSNEEEEAIIKLHHMLGNRWSAIATRLPGRTDNEIKNLWHTHLKKREKLIPATQNMLRWPWETPLRGTNLTDTFGLNVNTAAASASSSFIKQTKQERYVKASNNVEDGNGKKLVKEFSPENKYVGSVDSCMNSDHTVFWYNLFMNACKTHEE